YSVGMAACGEDLRSNFSARLSALDQQHFFSAVNLLQFHFDDLIVSGLNIATHKLRLDGKLAMPTIDERQQLYFPRAAVIEESVEGGAGGAASVENVVDQDDVFVI